MYTILPIFILMLVLFIASIFDIKTMTIPLWLWPIPILVKIINIAAGNNSGLEDSILYASILGILFFLFAYFSNFGGGDVLLIISIGFVLQKFGIYAVLFGFLSALPYTAYMRIANKEKEYPFAPFLLAGTTISVILMYI